MGLDNRNQAAPFFVHRSVDARTSMRLHHCPLVVARLTYKSAQIPKRKSV